MNLLTLAIIFGVAAIVLGLFGFGTAASAATTVAKFLFLIILVVFLVSLFLALA